MPAPLVVPDASVLLKWVLASEDEPDADKTLLLRGAIFADVVRVIVPPQWLYEVGNTIARRLPAHATACLSAMIKFGLPEAAPSASWLASALELTRTHRVTFYDAAYHALAISRKLGKATMKSRLEQRQLLAAARRERRRARSQQTHGGAAHAGSAQADHRRTKYPCRVRGRFGEVGLPHERGKIRSLELYADAASR